MPYDQPKIACLVVLDEPSHYNRFGGVSAAPVFARISGALASTSNLFDDVLVTNALDLEPRGERQLKAPNFLRLTKEAAMGMARSLDMNVLCRGTSGEVVSQTPGPGVTMSRDDVVRLELNGSPESTQRKRVPNLRGMSIREAKRHAVEAGYRCHITGTGVVKSQSPKPGTQSKSSVIKIVCKSRAVERG
ncbi:MAG: PASTA domain-containing protein [bacterium]|nr:PASTA domain-containing protein [bacterium]